MALFQEQIDKLTDQLERISPRERMLVGVGGLAAVILIGFLISVLLNSSLQEREASNRDLQLKLERIMQKQSEYLEARRKVKALEERISRNSVDRLIPFIDAASQRHNLKINAMAPVSEDTSTHKKTRVKEKSVKIELIKVPLVDVAKFFQDLERSGKVVKIRKLNMRPNFSEPKLINVDAVISTYSLEQ